MLWFLDRSSAFAMRAQYENDIAKQSDNQNHQTGYLWLNLKKKFSAAISTIDANCQCKNVEVEAAFNAHGSTGLK